MMRVVEVQALYLAAVEHAADAAIRELRLQVRVANECAVLFAQQ